MSRLATRLLRRLALLDDSVVITRRMVVMATLQLVSLIVLGDFIGHAIRTLAVAQQIDGAIWGVSATYAAMYLTCRK